MGYTTKFTGYIKIEPPAPSGVVYELKRFFDERHDRRHWPSYYCDFSISHDGKILAWNGSEKSYQMDAWMEVLIEEFFEPNGHTLNGELLANGTDPGDVWMLRVKDNEVSRINGTMIFEEK